MTPRPEAHDHDAAGSQMEAIDLVVTGWVAMARDRMRLGKGGGLRDLEYAVGRG